ncbi:MAG: hypothetical protein K8F30_04550, partial [Taibaiella sp.]|nr:hypothetical protein [Taibaiella sp.]
FIGGGTDFAIQIIIEGKSIDDVSLARVMLSAALGFFSGGAGAYIGHVGAQAGWQISRQLLAATLVDIGLGTSADVMFYDADPWKHWPIML